jgi:hypothetical protein
MFNSTELDIELRYVLLHLVIVHLSMLMFCLHTDLAVAFA